MRIKPEILQLIKKNHALRLALMDQDRKKITEYTLLKWIRENDTELCHKETLSIICAHLRMDEEAIIEYEECDFKKVI
jgi:hypothetical protein